MNAIRTPMQLALLLQGHRKEQKLSQLETAERVGMTQKMVSAFENHPERCSVKNLFKLLSALNLELVLRQKGDGSSTQAEW
ncbi:MAG: helix-turn-helix domain-containing protein [Chlorobiaceae bacterium]|nr:helix-turn-helix domain-containing protein [Chlorobiaceae bacterium]